MSGLETWSAEETFQGRGNVQTGAKAFGSFNGAIAAVVPLKFTRESRKREEEAEGGTVDGPLFAKNVSNWFSTEEKVPFRVKVVSSSAAISSKLRIDCTTGRSHLKGPV